MSQDLELKEGEVKVTVLATGFGMKNIPGMEPLIEAQKAEEEKITQEERRKRDDEEKKLSDMEKTFYKDEYKIFIFEEEDMSNDELISALDNSPAYKRTVQELDTLKKITAARKREEVTTPSTPAEIYYDNACEPTETRE